MHDRSLIVRYWISALALLFLAAPAFAHQLQVEPVVVVLRPQERSLTAQFTGNVQDILQAVEIGDAERDGDGFAPAAQQRLERYFNERFRLQQDGRTYAGTITTLRQIPGADLTQSRFQLSMRYETPGATSAAYTITSTLFDYLPNAVIVVSVRGFQRNLTAGQSATIDPGALATNLARTVGEFLVLGAEHIFTGPDHVLFILALLLVSTSLPRLIKTLSGFTLAHSITLILSALGFCTPSTSLVETFVYLSIIYVGVENLALKRTDHRFWVASAFGLVHGFAFAGNLRDIGLPEGAALFWSLLSFNLGVEIGQVIICALAFPLLMRWQRNVSARARYGGMDWPGVVRFASLGVVAAGGYWLLQSFLS